MYIYIWKFNLGTIPMSQWSVIGVTVQSIDFEPLNRSTQCQCHGRRVQNAQSVKCVRLQSLSFYDLDKPHQLNLLFIMSHRVWDHFPRVLSLFSESGYRRTRWIFHQVFLTVLAEILKVHDLSRGIASSDFGPYLPAKALIWASGHKAIIANLRSERGISSHTKESEWRWK